MVHELKTLPEFFNAVIKGEKTFEIRKNDRPFKNGDLLALNEYDGKIHTGRSCLVYIDYILDNPEYVKKDMVVMSIKPCDIYKYESPYNPYKGCNDYKVPLVTDNGYIDDSAVVSVAD